MKGKTYNHMFSLGFTVENESETGEETTNEEIISGILKRVCDLIDSGNEVQEAVQPPVNTYENF